MFNWVKKGLLFEPNMPGYTHASHPCIIHIHNDVFILAYTCRDSQQRSHVFLSYANVSEGRVVILGEPKLALAIGDPGCFDCDGVISGCLIENNGEYYLYYVGWQNLPDGLWLCDTGRAILDIDSLILKKEFAGPVLGRDKNNPLFAAATAFYITEDNQWHAWYNSGIRWEKTDKGWHHWYGFHHATSLDGIDWLCEPDLIIPFADEYEYAFGRPSVVLWDGVFHMWFAHRATKEISTYRMGYASSKDGLTWDRNDTISGIDVSVSGWDSEMICYPSVFEHKGYKYMLYNGNNYGETGFGFAVLEGCK
ncbi:hypothetical protein ACVBE9_01950 [Eionea flava]